MAEPVKSLDQSPKRLAQRTEAAKLLDAKDKLGVPNLPQESKNAVFEKLKARAREAGKKAEEMQSADPYAAILDRVNTVLEDKLPDNIAVALKAARTLLTLYRTDIQAEISIRRQTAELQGKKTPEPLSDRDKVVEKSRTLTLFDDEGPIGKLTDAEKTLVLQKLGILRDGTPIEVMDRIDITDEPNTLKTQELPAYRYMALPKLSRTIAQMPNIPGVRIMFDKYIDPDSRKVKILFSNEAINRVHG